VPGATAPRSRLSAAVPAQYLDVRDQPVDPLGGGPHLQQLDLRAERRELVQGAAVGVGQRAPAVGADQDVDRVQDLAELAPVAGDLLGDPPLQLRVTRPGGVDVDEAELVADRADEGGVEGLVDVPGERPAQPGGPPPLLPHRQPGAGRGKAVADVDTVGHVPHARQAAPPAPGFFR